MSKKFYIWRAFSHCCCTESAIADCYSDCIELRAKTARGALSEARRLQDRDDRRALRVINRASRAGLSTHELYDAFYDAPNYATCVLYDDEENDIYARPVES